MAEDAYVAYDPALLVLLIAVVGVFPIGTVLALDTGELAVVRRNNPGDLLHPVLEVFADANGEVALVDGAGAPLHREGHGSPNTTVTRAWSGDFSSTNTAALSSPQSRRSCILKYSLRSGRTSSR